MLSADGKTSTDFRFFALELTVLLTYSNLISKVWKVRIWLAQKNYNLHLAFSGLYGMNTTFRKTIWRFVERTSFVNCRAANATLIVFSLFNAVVAVVVQHLLMLSSKRWERPCVRLLRWSRCARTPGFSSWHATSAACQRFQQSPARHGN